ncbi:hypothetical protein ABZ016_20045 [Streptomyces sp. NPDC006372]|uniref:hypothetical protein n=1 Tax=Streptomyces sp. NPDC006372 TaxID=3155599 RepID=UPI0033A15E79
MPFPQLTLYRHDRHSRALITLAGEIDLTTGGIVRSHWVNVCATASAPSTST